MAIACVGIDGVICTASGDGCSKKEDAAEEEEEDEEEDEEESERAENGGDRSAPLALPTASGVKTTEEDSADAGVGGAEPIGENAPAPSPIRPTLELVAAEAEDACVAGPTTDGHDTTVGAHTLASAMSISLSESSGIADLSSIDARLPLKKEPCVGDGKQARQ